MVWVHPRNRKPAKKAPKRVFHHKSWQQCYDDWLRSLYSDHSHSLETVRVESGIARRFFADPRKTPDQYTQADVRSFIEMLTNGVRKKGTPPTQRTRNLRLAVIQSFYRFAAEYEVLYRGKPRPILQKRPPTSAIKAADTPDLHRSMSDEDVTRFFAAIPRTNIVGLRDYALFLFFFWTGRRRMEGRNLRWGDIQDVTFVENGCTRVGKWYHWRGKGKVSQSAAELPAPAWQAIYEYLVASGRLDDMKPDSPIFVAHHAGAKYYGEERPMGLSTINQIHTKYVKMAGLPPRTMIGVHDWRHTCACIWYKENQDILEVKRKLDHKDVQSTLKYLGDAVPQGDLTALKLASRYAHL